MSRKQVRTLSSKISSILFLVLMLSGIIGIGLLLVPKSILMRLLIIPEFFDVSLWLAVTAINLLIASQLVPSHYGQRNLYIRNDRLRITSIIISIIFLFIVAVKLFEMFLSS